MSSPVALRIASTVLVFGLAIVPFAARAQGGMRPAPQSFSMAEAYGEIEVLKQQMAQLKQAVVEQKASYDNQLTDARFRITALEASQKQGGTATQLQASINTLAFRVTALEGYQKQDGQGLTSLTGQLNATTNQLTALSNKFQSHTHTYQQTHIGFTNVSTGNGYASLIQKNVYEPQTSSPPN